MAVNCLVVYNFVLMYKPARDTERQDLDYFVFMDDFAQSPYKADAYLDPTGHADERASTYFMSKSDWKNALRHARRAIEKGVEGPESRLLLVLALRELGRPAEALDNLRQAKNDSQGMRLLEIELLHDLGQDPEALEQMNRLLPQAPSEVRRRLEHIRSEIEKGARRDRQGGVGESDEN